MSMCW